MNLKLPEKSTLQSLEKLLDAHMDISFEGNVGTGSTEKNIQYKKLVSVEAKMNDMRKVAEQSLINTWIASQSYAVTSISNP